MQDVIHLIQYYYHNSSWEGAATDVEGFRLNRIRGMFTCLPVLDHMLTPIRD